MSVSFIIVFSIYIYKYYYINIIILLYLFEVQVHFILGHDREGFDPQILSHHAS